MEYKIFTLIGKIFYCFFTTLADDFSITFATVGSNATLNCSSLSKESKVQWIRNSDRTIINDGEEISDKISPIEKFIVVGNNSSGEYNLTIINISRTDEGNYSCETKIDRLPIKRIVYLQVGDTKESDTYITNVSSDIKFINVNSNGLTIQHMGIYVAGCAICSILLLTASGIMSYFKGKTVATSTVNSRMQSTSIYEDIDPANEQRNQTAMSVV